MTEAPLRCSDGARDRADAVAGTAAPALRWLLVEHPGPWQRDAVGSSGIASHVLDELRSAAAAASARILLVRRPGRREATADRAWAVADSTSPGSAPVWGTWRHDRDLLDAAAVLRGEAADGGLLQDGAQRDGLPGSGPRAEPLLLVCAHGRHDVCCSVRGRPVALALQARWPSTTWECSHVGGDRFAANLVLLPDGVTYGALDPDTAVEVVERHLRGESSPAQLRGLSTEPPVAQAAVVEALRRYAPAGPRSFASTSVRRSAADRWAVSLAGVGGLPDLDVEVATSVGRPARLTCSGLREASATAYDVLSVTVAPGPR